MFQNYESSSVSANFVEILREDGVWDGDNSEFSKHTCFWVALKLISVTIKKRLTIDGYNHGLTGFSKYFMWNESRTKAKKLLKLATIYRGRSPGP